MAATKVVERCKRVEKKSRVSVLMSKHNKDGKHSEIRSEVRKQCIHNRKAWNIIINKLIVVIQLYILLFRVIR